MRFKLGVLIVVLVIMTGCNTVENENTIFAAASLTESLEEFNESFNEKTNIVLDSSTRLRVQIENGAKTDIYISANKKNVDLLQNKDLVVETKEILRNKMVLITPKNSEIKSFDDLGKDIKLIIAAEEVPCGRYAREVVKNHNELYGEKFFEKVIKNVVSEELNVKHVVSKILMKEADAGIVYATDITLENRDNLNVIEIEDEFNINASYWICLADSNSKNFYERIINNENLKNVFANKGFEVVY